MKSLGVQLGGMVLATFVAALLCGLFALPLVGMVGVRGSLAAAAVSLPVGAVVVVYFSRKGMTAEAIVAGTLMRMFLTTALAGVVALAFVELREPVYFLSLGVVYLANLAVETWFVLMSNSSSRRSSGLV